MNRKAISDFQWTIAFMIVILIIGVGWLAFVVRAGSGAEVAQDYMVRNLAYLSTTMLSQASIVSYCFNSKSDIDFQIYYNEKTVDVASMVKTGKITGFPTPSKYLHPFPSDHKLDTNTHINDLCMINFGKVFRVSPNSDIDECDVYSQYKFSKTRQDTKLLILTSSNETLEKLNSISSVFGTKTTIDLLDSIYGDKHKKIFDLVIIVEENEKDNPKILLGTPLKHSKKLGCAFNSELDIDVVQKDLGINIDSEIMVLILVDDLDTQKFISSINRFLD